MTYLADNLNDIKKRIEISASKSGREFSDINIIAVSKTVDIPVIEEAIRLGLTDFGESRVQELSNKIKTIPHANWHMIGRLQTNKVKDIIDQVVLIHSLDRWNLAETINRRAEFNDIIVPTLLQINVSGEKQKAGIEPDDIKSFLDSMGDLSSIRVLGFMTMAPEDENPENARPFFKELNLLKEKYSKMNFTNVDLKYLSMGMSQDYEVAIEEGSNMVRIGSSIFKENKEV
ncbi:MAG TPA: YggS family pyridoxal phosphate-dependent enzyme [Syntrophomonadaceae bacterium]|nr:YggS family pyridoxal phosphate-dependent enzyme [Syntrophomonadaceae bacterium]